MMVFEYAVHNPNLSQDVLQSLGNTYSVMLDGPSWWDRPNRHSVTSPMVSSANETRVFMLKSLRYRLERELL